MSHHLARLWGAPASAASDVYKRQRWLPGQDEWGEALKDCPGTEYMLVRPADLDAVYAKLMR